MYDNSFQVGWPEPAAPVGCSAPSVAAAASFDGEVVGEAVGTYTGKSYPVPRWGVDTVQTGHSGAIEAMSLWAGESVSGISRVQPAGEILRELVEEAEGLLRRWR